MTTRRAFKIEDPSRGPGRADFRAPDEGFGLEGTPKPKIQRDPSPQKGNLICGPPVQSPTVVSLVVGLAFGPTCGLPVAGVVPLATAAFLALSLSHSPTHSLSSLPRSAWSILL